jgi:phosphotransferase system enzyme I (PtsI)
MPDKPVTIRTLDINGDKAMHGGSDQDEANPALGLRAIRYCLQKPEVFQKQLRAILRAAHYGWVRLLIPMISHIEEIRQTRQQLAEVVASLEKEGIPYKKDIQLGAMIEVPSAALTADTLAKEVDFFSIGTNDLIQYTMAMDRGNRHVAYLYNPLHPAVLRLLKQVADAGRQHNVPVYMCGEMAGEPLYVPILLGLGISEFSTNPQAIPVIKNAIRMIDTEQARRTMDQVLALPTAEEIETLLQNTFADLLNNNHQRNWRR